MEWLVQLGLDVSSGTLLGTINEFMYRGGPLLWWLAAVLALFWVFTIERLLYLFTVFPKQQKRWVLQWQQREDRHSWFALTQRAAWLSQAESGLNKHLSLMKVLVALFPMLGLLGTVTGMISVFDVMATQGSAQPRLMAAGISMATLPTMAGMVAALVGMFVHARIAKLCQKRHLHLERLMRAAG
jgi:biopolymer transport protein ExbB